MRGGGTGAESVLQHRPDGHLGDDVEFGCEVLGVAGRRPAGSHGRNGGDRQRWQYERHGDADDDDGRDKVCEHVLVKVLGPAPTAAGAGAGIGTTGSGGGGVTSGGSGGSSGGGSTTGGGGGSAAVPGGDLASSAAAAVSATGSGCNVQPAAGCNVLGTVQGVE